MNLHLILGNKSYSSWSLRAWLLCAHAELDFSETVIPLFTPQGDRLLDELTPAGLVPVLKIDGKPVWDSLAIAETVAELFPEKLLWPEDSNARAMARSVSAEMHSGFFQLRNSMPMNCREKTSTFEVSEEVQADIDRICRVWSECRSESVQEGDWLFGRFSVADAMFAPVVSRFNSYGVELTGVARDYAQTVMNDPHMQRWYKAAREEPWRIAESDKPFL